MAAKKGAKAPVTEKKERKVRVAKYQTGKQYGMCVSAAQMEVLEARKKETGKGFSQQIRDALTVALGTE